MASAPQTIDDSGPDSGPGASVRRIVLIAALGYFVDIFDLFLFSVLRVPSLRSVGVEPQHFLPAGALLLSWQMVGLLCGSFVWGLLGDRRGRLASLYGSILLYSIATLGNAFVTSLPAYAACRFVAGLGLGGELGAAVTLVSETLSRERRGLGTMVVAGCGLCGGVAAAGMAELLPWRVCYGIGGGLGLLLLALRVRLHESPLFVATRSARTASLGLLFRTARRRGIYLRLVLIGVPIWFVAGVLMVFSPEIARTLEVGGVTAARAVLFSYLGVALGDFLSGALSQYLRSRKRAIGLFLVLLAVGITLFLHMHEASQATFYVVCFVLGLGTGYWAVLITCAAENFGTNLRATVATTVPNLVRASAIPLTFAFQRLAARLGPRFGLIEAAAILGALCLTLAFWALFGLAETFEKGLDFEEL